MADSLDMLGDAAVYGLTLVALHRSARWQAGAAFAKGAFMLLSGLGVLAEAAHRSIAPVTPTAATMGLVAALALAANLSCFALLMRHRDDSLNMRSTWLCSRNDLTANIGVLAAAGASVVTESHWPDLVVGVLITAVFVRSALSVLSASVTALRAAPRANGGMPIVFVRSSSRGPAGAPDPSRPDARRLR